MAREARVNVMVEPYTRERLEFFAKGMGLSISSLCSYVLGNYVFQQDVVLNKMLEALSPEMLEKLTEAQVEHARKQVELMEAEGQHNSVSGP